jgi:hypothetical protein
MAAAAAHQSYFSGLVSADTLAHHSSWQTHASVAAAIACDVCVMLPRLLLHVA